jgi:hypothetical protein
MDSSAYVQSFVCVREAYREVPTRRLTAQHVQELCGVELAVCASVLDQLVDAKVLYRSEDGSYVKVTADHDRRRMLSVAAARARAVLR